MRIMVAGHWKLIMTTWEQSSTLVLLELHKLSENLASTILWSFGIWSKLERYKSSVSECLMSWLQIKNIVILKCRRLVFCATAMNHFLIRLWCMMKNGFYMTISDNQLSGWTEKLWSTSQSQTCTPKKSHSHCLVVCCPSDPLQLSESQWNHYIWEVCSANRWDALKTATPAGDIGQQKRPSSSLRHCLTAWCTTNASEIEGIGLQSFASSAIFTCPLAQQLPLFQAPRQLFAGKMLPQAAEGRKCLPRFPQILKK